MNNKQDEPAWKAWLWWICAFAIFAAVMQACEGGHRGGTVDEYHRDMPDQFSQQPF